jgi:hypothetical protein
MYIKIALNELILLIKKGMIFMTGLIVSVKNSVLKESSPFLLSPKTNYGKHVPKSAEQLMKDNWNKTGRHLKEAMKKVGDEIEKQK